MEETMDLLAKRERQARRLLRVCLRPISTECIQRYVDGYEAGALVHGSPQLCAVGTMSCGHLQQWHRETHPHHRESFHIENIFEGWELFRGRPLSEYFYEAFERHGREPVWYRDFTNEGERTTRRRWIYEACIEALALRASARISHHEVVGVEA